MTSMSTGGLTQGGPLQSPTTPLMTVDTPRGPERKTLTDGGDPSAAWPASF